jgi:hypothetical protein
MIPQWQQWVESCHGPAFVRSSETQCRYQKAYRDHPERTRHR